MDYARIYEGFIASRRSSPEPEGYTEVHHILPRSLGGDDSPSNLISLTPEDHFFAHLLLAKAYGGMLWVPVVMWLGGERRRWSGKRSRLDYGWVRREASRAVSGEGAWQYDRRTFCLEHKDGRTFSGNQSGFSEQFGLDKSGVCMLVNGVLSSYKGWFISGRRPRFIGRGSRKGADHPMARNDTIELHHVDGRLFCGTPYEFRLKTGINKASVSRLINGKQVVAAGWHLPGSTPPKIGRGAAYSMAA